MKNRWIWFNKVWIEKILIYLDSYVSTWVSEYIHTMYIEIPLRSIQCPEGVRTLTMAAKSDTHLCPNVFLLCPDRSIGSIYVNNSTRDPKRCSNCNLSTWNKTALPVVPLIVQAIYSENRLSYAFNVRSLKYKCAAQYVVSNLTFFKFIRLIRKLRRLELLDTDREKSKDL